MRLSEKSEMGEGKREKEKRGEKRQTDSETEKNEEVAVSGRRAFTPTNYNSRRCYAPLSVPPSRRESEALSLRCRLEGHQYIRHNGEKPTLYIEPIEVTACTEEYKSHATERVKDKGGNPPLRRIRALLFRAKKRRVRLAPTYTQTPSADTDRLPPQGNYERRPGLVGPSRERDE